MPHTTISKITVTPFPFDSKSKANFGATITGADLNDLDEEEFNTIRNAIYTHKVIIVTGQQNTLPVKHFEFVHRLDPEAAPVHGFTNTKNSKATSDDYGVVTWLPVPDALGVQMMGRGYQGKDHYGLKDVTLRTLTHRTSHATPLSVEEMEKGNTRFESFHFDGSIYGAYPSRVTALRCIKSPKGPDLTVRWDDGTGQTIKAKPGCTAFIDSAELYNLLTDDEKKLADHSRWEPAPHPYTWHGTRKLRSCGYGVEAGGEAVALDKLPEWTSDKIHQYPMVWVNPVTGVRSFQILPDVVRKLYLKSSPNEQEREVEDGEEIRRWLNNILDRICKPEYVNIPRYDEGDIVMWNNWEVMHSAIEYPLSYGVRTMHQCHIASTTPPTGPISAL